MVHRIPHDLLVRYCKVIKKLEKCRQLKNLQAYRENEVERQSIHNDILQIAETDRNDQSFTIALATLVDEMSEE